VYKYREGKVKKTQKGVKLEFEIEYLKAVIVYFSYINFLNLMDGSVPFVLWVNELFYLAC